MTPSKRGFTKATVLSFINSRKTIDLSHVGKIIQTQITSKGNLIDVTEAGSDKPVIKDGQPLQKMIYNVKLNSSVALANPRNKAIVAEAMKLENEGKADEATEKYRDFLNAVQVSFSVWANSASKFNQGQPVAGQVELVTTEKGQLLKLTNVYAVAPEQASATTVGSIEELLGIGSDDTDDDVIAEDAQALLAGSK